MSARKLQAWQRGLEAEKRAAVLLIAEGWQILRRRHRTPLGEIDIIAQRDDALLFVEVKYRRDLDSADFALTRRQQVRIIRAAALSLDLHPEWTRENTFIDLISFDAHWQMRRIRSALCEA